MKRELIYQVAIFFIFFGLILFSGCIEQTGKAKVVSTTIQSSTAKPATTILAQTTAPPTTTTSPPTTMPAPTSNKLRFAYLSREYAIQIKSVQSSEENVSKYSIVGGEIPLVYYGTVDGVHLGYREAPHATAQVAREAFYAYEKTGSKENLSRALFLVDHLLNNTVDRGDYMVWEYAFPWPGYSLEKGWRGSLCQAGILKALMLAYKYTGEERYRLASQKALNAFSVPLDEGGLLKLREGYYWYPEYVTEAPPYVLNGFATSLIWIKEYHEATKNPLAERLFNEGVSSLIHFLPTYDLDKGSYYDTMGHIASPHYHSIHIYQMKTLFEMTGDPIFQEYQLKWNASSQR